MFALVIRRNGLGVVTSFARGPNLLFKGVLQQWCKNFLRLSRARRVSQRRPWPWASRSPRGNPGPRRQEPWDGRMIHHHLHQWSHG